MQVYKTYHVLIYTTLTTNASNFASSLCFFDWGQLPKSRWRVTMYAEIGNGGYTTNQTMQVFADFSQSRNELVRNSSGAFPSTNKDYKNYLGTVLNFTNRSANCSFHSKATDNGASYLDATPTNNLFNLYIYNHGSAQNLFSPNTNGNTALFGFAFEMLDDPIYRTVRNTYNIVFNSENGTKNYANVTMNSFGDITYYFDWTQIKQGEYLVTATLYTSKDDTGTINYSCQSIYCDLGQGNNSVFNVKSQSGGNLNQNINTFLGIAPYTLAPSLLPIIAYRDSTPPIYLSQRPTNNLVRVTIRNHYMAQFILERLLAVSMNYTLCLNFQWLGEKY
jgi:hypothetical protein